MTREEALEVMWKNLPSDKNLPVYEALQTLIPELRESEDERIRKDIINLIYWLKANPSLCSQYYNDRYDSILAWLEKQKNLVPKFRIGDIVQDTKFKEEPDYFILSIDEKGYNLEDGGFIPFSLQDEYTLVGRFNPNPEDYGIRKHVPVRFEEEDGEKYPVVDYKILEQKSVNVDYISGIRKELLGIEDNAKNIDGLTESQWVAIRAAHRLLGEYVEQEQKPEDRFKEAREKYQVEWSEEDENMFNDILLDMADRREMFKSKGETTFAENTQKKIDWLDSHHLQLKYQSSCPQPKKEWSGRDEEILEFVLGLLDNLVWRRDWEISQAECLEWLVKSLNPTKQEWSEEDEKMRVNILNALTPQLVYSVGKGTCTGTSTYKYDDEIKWLKSLRPSWKPSNEQMCSLKDTIVNTKGYQYSVYLPELYEQLKKLM